MNYKCVTNKIGTLLYARDSDLLKCSSLALHDLHTCSLPRDIEVLPLQTIQTNDASLIRKAADIINYAIQEEIKKVKEHVKDLTAFTVMESIESTNSLLWEFICLCTRSVRECVGRTNSDILRPYAGISSYVLCCLQPTLPMIQHCTT